RAVVRSFDHLYLDRITQLINRTNQFNLTTLRLNRSKVEEMMASPEWLCLYARLADRFGDNGLISVFAARSEAAELFIEIWLMSCRVLKRGMENLLLNCVIDRSREMGATALRGVYRPTRKNGLVKEHYRELGFSPVGQEADGTTHWRLEIDGCKPFDVPIELAEDY
ncbi:MAG: HAD-IIIC family phosphatase, partial [Vicinamibacteria bacterium]